MGDKNTPVNMNTEEEILEQKKQNGSNLNDTSKVRIVFNENDLRNASATSNTVRRIEDPRTLFAEDKEKMKPKDVRKALFPTIGLMIFCIINELFIIPLISKTIITELLHGKMDLTFTFTNLSNEQLLNFAGVIAIVSYAIFSLGLIGFCIYNFYEKVYVKKDMSYIAFRIFLYSFLIGFFVVVIDSAVKINLSNYVVKAVTFFITNITKFLK